METYKTPKMEIIEFEVEDVITTSGDGEGIDMPPISKN